MTIPIEHQIQVLEELNANVAKILHCYHNGNPLDKIWAVERLNEFFHLSGHLGAEQTENARRLSAKLEQKQIAAA